MRSRRILYACVTFLGNKSYFLLGPLSETVFDFSLSDLLVRVIQNNRREEGTAERIIFSR